MILKMISPKGRKNFVRDINILVIDTNSRLIVIYMMFILKNLFQSEPFISTKKLSFLFDNFCFLRIEGALEFSNVQRCQK